MPDGPAMSFLCNVTRRSLTRTSMAFFAWGRTGLDAPLSQAILPRNEIDCKVCVALHVLPEPKQHCGGPAGGEVEGGRRAQMQDFVARPTPWLRNMPDFGRQGKKKRNEKEMDAYWPGWIWAFPFQ